MTQERTMDTLYRFGDVYDTLDTCQQLDLQLGRLRRQRLIEEAEWMRCKHWLAQIREQVEARIHTSAFTPRSPQLR